MNNDSIYKLVSKLIEKTEQKKAQWSKSSRHDEFKINLNAGVITIMRNTDSHSDFIHISIFNSNAEEIFSEVYGVEGNSIATDLFNKLVKLFVSAKSSYFKVEETFDGFLDELESEGEVGRIDDTENIDDELPF